jgi:phosphoribosylaminoimidazolecarboxamide formyltransferase/IMP cyclohydrolase
MTREVEAGWPKAALLSLSDKSGVAEFARELAAHGTQLIASGGTAAHLAAAGLEVTTVEHVTGSSELLGGRVKTLHPRLHAGILARRDDPSHARELETAGISPIDLVVVSLYPFEERAPKLDEAGAIEEIDIGGVALLRAAAKNFEHVVALHDPAQYGEALAAYRAGGPSLDQRRRWALSVFARTARYDSAIAGELERRAAGPDADEAPGLRMIALQRVRRLRYGENPHQAGALYARLGEAAKLEAWKEGKELSYNNLLDLEAAVRLAGRFPSPACVIVKHNEPCGAACGASVLEAWRAARRSDELSAFGGVVAFNRALDAATAAEMATMFIECVAAPDFGPGVEAAFQSRKGLRLVRLGSSDLAAPDEWRTRLVGRWALLQKEAPGPAPEWRVASKRAPSELELRGLRFAWEIASAARSNAIAIARGEALIGLGSGQTSRVDAVDLALMKARRCGHDVAGAALASDGYFPFPDGVAHAGEAGITAIVQPGGSVKDAEVIAGADERGIAMMLTDRRSFRH